MATVSSALSLSHSWCSEGVTGTYILLTLGWLWLSASDNAGVYWFRRSTAWGDDSFSPRQGRRRGVLAPRLGATIAPLHGRGGDGVLAPRLGATIAPLHGRGGDGALAPRLGATIAPLHGRGGDGVLAPRLGATIAPLHGRGGDGVLAPRLGATNGFSPRQGRRANSVLLKGGFTRGLAGDDLLLLGDW